MASDSAKPIGIVRRIFLSLVAVAFMTAIMALDSGSALAQSTFARASSDEDFAKEFFDSHPSLTLALAGDEAAETSIEVEFVRVSATSGQLQVQSQGLPAPPECSTSKAGEGAVTITCTPSGV